MIESLDLVTLNFSKDTLLLLNICLAFIMFGVALELKVGSFKEIIKSPINLITGLVSQFLLLPAVTYGLVLLLEPSPSIALGMILVASCPGGNVSNFFSMLAKGNIALSVSMTTVSSLSAVILTPLNFTFWGNLYGPSSSLLQKVDLNVTQMVLTILFVLVIPLIIGMVVNEFYPVQSAKYKKPIRQLSIALFAIFILAGFAANYQNFLQYITQVTGIVFFHNAIAVIAGFGLASLARLPLQDRRTISIETGIQNSGLALVLIFDFFNGLGGMAFIAAWWSVWHLISGIALSSYWSRR